MEPLGDKQAEKLFLFPEYISLENVNFHFENILSKGAEIKGQCLYKVHGLIRGPLYNHLKPQKSKLLGYG